MVTQTPQKKLQISIILFLCLVFNILIFPQTVDSLSGYGRLVVIIKGFENDNGDCRFALDNSKSVYESEDSVWIGKELPIKNKEAVVTIDSLKYGVYAIRVYQDKNKNNKLDSDILGIPTENYGFSNNASGWFGPPSWDKAKFIFNKPELIMEIDID
ncbi:MAG: DUF2141 domain-containing protein [Ignavibacteriaceae bacterium]